MQSRLRNSSPFMALTMLAIFAWWVFAGLVSKNVAAQGGTSALAQPTIKGQRITTFLSRGGLAARQAVLRRAGIASFRALSAPGTPADDGGEGLIPPDKLGIADEDIPPGPPNSGGHPLWARNVFVNDPCLDPPPEAPFPTNFFRTVQSETEIAVLNRVDNADADDDGDSQDEESGRLMVAGYNDSFGFYNNTQGLSGFSYSTNGGRSWVDGGGLPPVVPSEAPAGTPGSDAYFGDPVVVVHHRSKVFYYSSIYLLPDGTFTLAVNRGKFRVAPPQGIESRANTRCEGHPAMFGVPDPPPLIQKRIIWEPPVVAVPVIDPADFIDKEWLYVDQKTGELYLAYVRFGADGSTPLELVRSFDGGHTWTPPSIIVPNLADTFNTGVQPITTPTGRVIITWHSRTYDLAAPEFPEISQRIEEAYSDDDGVTFSRPVLVANVNPQGEPPGYNRGRTQILNAPYIAVDRGKDDGVDTWGERTTPGFGSVYITYFDGLTPFPPPSTGFLRAAEIHLSRSTNNGTTWGPEIKVNDDRTPTSHVFPSVQVNMHGTVFVTWIDRRVDPVKNLLSDTWAALSGNHALSFGNNIRVTDVSTDWLTRADARPNFGDYNSSEVIGFDKFASIWSDGRFPRGTFVDRGRVRRAATPDSLFSIVDGGPPGDGKDRDR